MAGKALLTNGGQRTLPRLRRHCRQQKTGEKTCRHCPGASFEPRHAECRGDRDGQQHQHAESSRGSDPSERHEGGVKPPIRLGRRAERQQEPGGGNDDECDQAPALTSFGHLGDPDDGKREGGGAGNSTFTVFETAGLQNPCIQLVDVT